MDYNKQQKIWEHRGVKASGFFTKHPIMSLFLVAVFLGMLGLGLKFVAAPIWFANNAVAVAKQEFSPKEMLRKYEWFKDAAATLDKKKADISIYQKKIDKYNNKTNLSRIAEEKVMTWEQELAGIISSFNSLASEFNSGMAKFNWAFCNKGTLPNGASEPLPKKYKSYIY